MNKLLAFVISLSLLSLSGCDDESDAESGEFTGRELSYELLKASDFDISGTVNFRERTDQFVQIEVILSGTEGDITHPVHLHYGDLSTPNADIAVLLNDLLGNTGESVTVIDRLSDESKFAFEEVKNFEGSIKVHLSSFGDGRHVVLAAGNIGASALKSNVGGRSQLQIAVCKSE